MRLQDDTLTDRRGARGESRRDVLAVGGSAGAHEPEAGPERA